MAADYTYITDTGTIIPDTGAIQDQVIDEFKTAFGSDLITTPDTPQGVLIVGESLARSSVARNNASVANQMNPNISGGVFLDAVGALTGDARTPGTFSRVPGVVLTGIPGTVITADVSIRGTDFNDPVFQIANLVVIPTEGTTTADFIAVDPGSIAAPANTLTVIVNGVLGLETVNNPNAATLGQLTQSDVSFRAQRRNSLATQGSSLAEAITSALSLVPGVRPGNYRFQENVTSATVVINGVTMVPHSLYACVDGGTNLAVATAILSKKSGGCDYNTGPGIPTTVNVTEPASGQIFPVSFDRPDLILILVRATVHVINAVGDPVALVKKAILDYANGLIDGEPGFTVGSAISCFELAGAINIEVPGLYVVNLETAKVTPPYANDPIPIAVWEKGFTNEDSITVNVV